MTWLVKPSDDSKQDEQLMLLPCLLKVCSPYFQTCYFNYGVKEFK